MGIRLKYAVPVSLSTAAIILILIVGFLLVKSFNSADEWRTFDSNPTRYKTDYPAGYRLEYPANWESQVYNGYHNSEDLLVVFRQPFSSNPRAVKVFWYAQDEIKLQSVIEWGDEIMSDLAIPKSTPHVTETIGAENYVVVKKEYTRIRKQNDYQVCYFIIADNEAFMLSFHAKEYDEQTEAIFDRMLASFHIYK